MAAVKIELNLNGVPMELLIEALCDELEEATKGFTYLLGNESLQELKQILLPLVEKLKALNIVDFK